MANPVTFESCDIFSMTKNGTWYPSAKFQDDIINVIAPKDPSMVYENFYIANVLQQYIDNPRAPKLTQEIRLVAIVDEPRYVVPVAPIFRPGSVVYLFLQYTHKTLRILTYAAKHTKTSFTDDLGKLEFEPIKFFSEMFLGNLNVVSENFPEVRNEILAKLREKEYQYF